MFRKFEKLLFLFDFSGPSTYLRILNNKNYKSFISSIISIIIIITSISFTIYSLIDFLNQNPMVSYYKSIDNNINKTFVISDSLIIFKLKYLSQCIEENYKEKRIDFFHSNNPLNFKRFELEICELGKNIDLKYKEIIEDFERKNHIKINGYLCPNFRNEKISLYDIKSNSGYLKLKIRKDFKFNCSTNFPSFEVSIITESDIINHNNKKNPYFPSYHNEKVYINENTDLIQIHYNYNYIKYESDIGLFFQRNIHHDLITFSDIEYSYDVSDNPKNLAISIDFKFNSNKYDYYIRSYQKIQSMIAGVASVVNLLMLVGKILSYFLLHKQMSRDVFRTIINNEKIYENNINLTFDNNKFNKNIEIKTKDLFSEKEIKSKIELNSISTNSNSENKDKQTNNKKLTKIKILNQLNFFDFFKSYFCFKSPKYKLIDICHDLFKEEICIDRILKRLYNLENYISFNKDKSLRTIQTKSQYELIDEYLSIIINEKIQENKK